MKNIVILSLFLTIFQKCSISATPTSYAMVCKGVGPGGQYPNAFSSVLLYIYLFFNLNFLLIFKMAPGENFAYVFQKGTKSYPEYDGNMPAGNSLSLSFPSPLLTLIIFQEHAHGWTGA
jgi:hypothetical protein